MPLAYIMNLFGPDIIVLPTALLVLGTFVVHALLAMGVWGDAEALLLERRYLYILKPGAWALTVFITGILGTAVYWLINRSTLRRD